MTLQSVLAKQLGLTAAATLALGLTAVSAAQADDRPTPSAFVANDTLTVVGTSHDDSIQVSVPAADPNSLSVDFGNGSRPATFDRSTFSAVAVFLRSGDDTFGIGAGSGSLAADALRVFGGSGDDSITGGDGDDVLSGGSGDDVIRGGDGTDLIYGDSGKDDVDGGRGNDVQILGSGRDSALWNPGEGSDTIDGGRGEDTLVFNGAGVDETMSLSAEGHHAIFLRDIARIRMDLDGVEQLNLAALGGSDNVTVDDLSGTDLRRANIDLSAAGKGDGKPDVVTVNGTDRADRIDVGARGDAVQVSGLSATTTITGSEPAADVLQVNGQGGNDRVAVGKDASALIGVAVDLGADQQ